MHGRFAIELRRDRLLHEILSFDDTRQRRLDDLVTALSAGTLARRSSLSNSCLVASSGPTSAITWPTAACSACFLPHPASSIAAGRAHAIAAIRHRRRDIGVMCSKAILLSCSETTPRRDSREIVTKARRTRTLSPGRQACLRPPPPRNLLPHLSRR